jgi:hypothetical protein
MVDDKQVAKLFEQDDHESDDDEDSVDEKFHGTMTKDQTISNRDTLGVQGILNMQELSITKKAKP